MELLMGIFDLPKIDGHCHVLDPQRFPYPADVAYMYNGFTSPDFRGKRLHGLAMGLALRALALPFR